MTHENQLPSHQWRFPSYWKPVVTKVDSMLRLDFENPLFDTKFNTTDRSNVQLIDRVLLPKHRPAAQENKTNGASSHNEQASKQTNK